MLTRLFSIDIYKTHYADVQELTTLTESLLQILPFSQHMNRVATKSPPFPPGVDSTTMHWTKFDPNHPPEFFHKHPLFTNIVNFIHHHAKIYWQELGYASNLSPRIVQSWTQRYQPGSNGSAIHNHSLIPMSGSLYFDAGPDQGNIVFEDPLELLMSQIPWRQRWDRNSRLKDIDVNTGTLLLWPGWLKHGVMPNVSNRIRYSWNFDLHAPAPDPVTKHINNYQTSNTKIT